MKNGKIKLLLYLFLISATFLNIFSTVYSHKEIYLSQNYWQRYPQIEKTFLSSQYVSKHPDGWIPDEAAFAYSGGAYIKGANPVFVVPDAPPLGKYLIGLSAALFNNENILILINSILSLFFLYLLGVQVFSSKFLGLIPPFLLSFEPIFKNQFIYSPLFDTTQLLLLCLSFYFFNLGVLKKKNYLMMFLIANIFLGIYISVKFFITGLVIFLAFFLVLLIHKDKKRIASLTLTFPVSILILLLSYVRVLAFDPDMRHFLGIQKWVFIYHQGQLMFPFSVWPLLFLNKWYVWFGNSPVINDSQWLITWPIITVLSFVCGIFYFTKKIKRNRNIEVIMVWSFLYLAFLSIGQITTRYFIILIPMLYLISVYFIYNIFINKEIIKK